MAGITFLVTNYNYGKYVQNAVESIVRLNSKEDHDFHLLIGDDCSTDGCSQDAIQVIQENFSDNFETIHVIKNESNLGKNNLLNQLMPIIPTELCVILDADDMLLENFLQSTYPVLMAEKENTNVGFVYSDCKLVNDAGDYLDTGKSTKFSHELLQNYSFIPQTNLIYTKALQDSLPLDESVRVGTKHHKWKKMCAKGWEGKYIDEPLFLYRMHAKNISKIGEKILSEEGYAEIKGRLLQGYWPTAG